MSDVRLPTRADADLAGREVTPLASPFLVVAAMLALVAGLDAFAGSSHSADFFAWGTQSPVTAVLLGAGLLGVVPMLLAASYRVLWEGVRIAILPALVLVLGMAGVSLEHHGDLALGGGQLIAFVLAWGWLLAMLGLSVFAVVVLVAQLREPGRELPRSVTLPRLVLPALAVEGAAFLGLGLGLLGAPDFWGAQVPWEVSTIDARALGVWSLTLGWALLQALAEDELHRVRPGLLAVIGVGVLGLAGLAWHHAHVDWSTWGAAAALALLGGLVTTGVIGLAILRRSGVEGVARG